MNQNAKKIMMFVSLILILGVLPLGGVLVKAKSNQDPEDFPNNWDTTSKFIPESRFNEKDKTENLDSLAKEEITNRENEIWKSIQENEQDYLKFTRVINGYIVNINTGEISTDLRNKSTLVFIKEGKEFNIKLEVFDYKFNFDLQETTGSIFISETGDFYLVYNFDDPKNGFFADFVIDKYSCAATVVFTQNEEQFNYHLSVELEKVDFKPFIPTKFEPTSVVNIVYSGKTASSSYDLALEDLNSLTIHGISLPETKSSFTYYYYGLSHECFDFGVDYPSELPDDYWEPHTAIDVGIHRLHPSESQVKSDIQTYCKQDYWNHGFSGTIRKVLAYCMGTHGGPQYEIYEKKWWGQKRVGTIYPSEIESLWYYELPGASSFYWIQPDDTLCMADISYGYYKPPSTNPTMAKAWVDEPDIGANAYVGATISPPGDSDAYMSVFWDDLCQDNNDVEHAVDELCDEYGNGWNTGDEWKILGDSSATIQN
ncbi:MAG: hypothetical protein ACTSRE_13250 [Promethearchaeota archaeon]